MSAEEPAVDGTKIPERSGKTPVSGETESASPRPSAGWPAPSAAPPSEASLHAAMSHNLEMVKHAQDLRDRLNNLYWITWAALLAYLGAANPKPEIVAGVSAFLLVASVVVLLSSLRWSAEFANHVAAIGACARALRLNADRVDDLSRRHLLLIGAYRPFDEFRGFVALPLRLPLFLHAGVLTCAYQSLGAAVATYGFVLNTDSLNRWGFKFFDPGWASAALAAACASFALCGVVCVLVYRFTIGAVAERIPLPDGPSSRPPDRSIRQRSRPRFPMWRPRRSVLPPRRRPRTPGAGRSHRRWAKLNRLCKQGEQAPPVALREVGLGGTPPVRIERLRVQPDDDSGTGVGDRPPVAPVERTGSEIIGAQRIPEPPPRRCDRLGGAFPAGVDLAENCVEPRVIRAPERPSRGQVGRPMGDEAGVEHLSGALTSERKDGGQKVVVLGDVRQGPADEGFRSLLGSTCSRSAHLARA